MEENRTPEYVLKMEGMCKSFGKLQALDQVDLTLHKSEILSLLGENGSGKTTLMNVLFGIYAPDAGQIYMDGKLVAICSPKDAMDLGIGMVHQHVHLVSVLTVAENIILGLSGSATLNRRKIAADILALAQRYGFDINPEEKIYNLSVSQKQMVEIVKVLYRGAETLILDEPTAVLTPQEIEKLFAVLRAMRQDGKSIIIITHKLQEVLAVSDRVQVLRKGQHIATVATAAASRESLTEMMVGRKVDLAIDRPAVEDKTEILQVNSLTCLSPDGHKVLDNISFTLSGGEILGVAGISGSGQKELCEALTGLQPVVGGSVLFHNEVAGVMADENLVGQKPDAIMRKGVSLAFVPEDRLGMGLVPSLGMVDNIMLKSYRQNKGAFVDRKTPTETAKRLVQQLAIATPDVFTPIRRLSGGNVQKILVGREIECNPRLLIVAYPVRGLDINSSYTIYNLLNEQKKKGVAILFIGEDLDVLMEISDRLLVLCDGKLSGLVDPRQVSKEEVGLMMVQHPDETVSPKGVSA